jgi:hypothetical protein
MPVSFLHFQCVNYWELTASRRRRPALSSNLKKDVVLRVSGARKIYLRAIDAFGMDTG